MSAANPTTRQQRRAADREVRRLVRTLLDAPQRAGVDAAHLTGPNLYPTPWKADDARWFASHPGRSHRLRQRFPGEGFGRDIPNLDQVQVDLVLIRQIEPGTRVRKPFMWRACMPDFLTAMRDAVELCEHSEAAAHALFDLPSKTVPINVAEIGQWIGQYASKASETRQ
jgi:hypothetical protein